MPPRLPIVTLFALLSLSFGTAALTSETRIAVLDPTPQLLDAVSVALLPWGLRVVPVTGMTPTGDIQSDKAGAGALARTKDVEAVVWLVAPPGGVFSLCLYDVQTDRVTVRPLSRPPPLDEASAAAVALTVKTLLRATTIAPLAERSNEEQVGAAPASASASASASAPAPAPVAASASGGGHSPTHVWRLDALLTAHVPTATDAALAPRGGIAVTVWPRPWRERIGLGLELRAGTGLDFASSLFVGTFTDTQIIASARTLVGSERFSVEFAVGPSLQVTSFSGTALAAGRTASIVRADPAFDAEITPQLSFGGRLRLGVLLGSTLLLRTQRYVLHDQTLLRVPPLGFDFGGRASLALD